MSEEKPGADFAPLFGGTEVPVEPRNLSTEELLVLQLNQTRLESSTKDLLLIDQQTKLLVQKRAEVSSRLTQLQDVSTMFYKALCANLGLKDLSEWQIEFQTGKLTKINK